MWSVFTCSGFHSCSGLKLIDSLYSAALSRTNTCWNLTVKSKWQYADMQIRITVSQSAPPFSSSHLTLSLSTYTVMCVFPLTSSVFFFSNCYLNFHISGTETRCCLFRLRLFIRWNLTASTQRNKRRRRIIKTLESSSSSCVRWGRTNTEWDVWSFFRSILVCFTILTLDCF